MTPSINNENPVNDPLLSNEKIYLSVSRGMKIVPEQIASYGLGVEIQDFASLSGMRGAKAENLEYWDNFLKIYHPSLTFHGPFIDLHPGSDEEWEREYAFARMSESVDVAKRLGAELVVLHSCWPPAKAKKYGNWDNLEFIRHHFERLTPVAEESGIVIAIENVYEPDPDMLLDIVRGIDSPHIRLCLDTGHANIKSEIPINEWLRIYGEYLVYIHLHDNNGKKDRHMSLGEGNMDFEPFFDVLREMKYSGRICIETSPERWEPTIEVLREEKIIT